MFLIQLAGCRIRMENRYPYVECLCRDYLADGENFDFSVFATEEEIKAEQSLEDFPADYCESICLYRHICEKLSAYGVFLMHSSVMEVDGLAYAFTAPSGTGKSTHSALWLKNIPHARVLNGDKPLYRLNEDNTFTVYGTPWNGKENWGTNISAPLAGICFLQRGEKNSIRPATEEDVIPRLMHQLYLRGPKESAEKQLVLIDSLVRYAKFWILTCNISDEAAKLSYETMRNFAIQRLGGKSQ